VLQLPTHFKAKREKCVRTQFPRAPAHNTPDCVSFSCRRCFLSFYLKAKVFEVLISSGIETHTFGPTNVREHFPEEELTVGKSKLLAVDILVEL